ncbi:molybdopterin molybdochelatase /molybdenum cofactor cytidylyltransferase [Rhizobium sp. PP-F2F-G48]|uniref:NTP transferase domain-containing protein n=1 Tax=Rhizobium sp. PP-F2F-G48 TaxID=2135651 RepID=UPI00105081F8|nr:molybdopterin-binding/glycosyltransferase family 2 protein [Rhizobium sp. PP-F2F-G48]TCM58954.1 molybdopterin molybdochelatase /molybdenum cofactor cytidylyltransferase [Rhizobium sp. PP-F2F-G48]
MRFGPVPLAEAEGSVLAHAVALPDRRLAKGRSLGAADIEALSAIGMGEIVVARLDAEDIGEDEAATLIATRIAPDHMTLSPASTGRLNLHAAVDGLFVATRARVDGFNRVDPAMTLACLADHVAVRAGDMVATIKIIPLAVNRRRAEEAAAILGEAPAFAVKPFLAHAVSLIATTLPSLKPQVMDKTRRVLDDRLRRSGSCLIRESRVAHREDAVADAIRRAIDEPGTEPGAKPGAELGKRPKLVIVFGASAVTDADDVIPAAIRLAGGTVDHVGMPVDPGNLLVLGTIGDVRIIGAPGCARSPKENGFDWVLDRLIAGETVGATEITGMGVGGLLAEIPTRPRPRARSKVDGSEETARPRLIVRSVVLAAGQASRMGAAGHHKLLAEFDGVPLVRRTTEIALAASAAPVTVVTGHREADIRDALSGLDLVFAQNDDFASGMASSLITGLDSIGAEADGMLVLLADMPGVTADDLRRLISAFEAHGSEDGGEAVVRAVYGGKRGNPVILPRALFPALRRLEGDVGARHVIENGNLPVVDVDIGPAAHLDLDTPDAIAAAGGVLRG